MCLQLPKDQAVCIDLRLMKLPPDELEEAPSTALPPARPAEENRAARLLPRGGQSGSAVAVFDDQRPVPRLRSSHRSPLFTVWQVTSPRSRHCLQLILRPAQALEPGGLGFQTFPGTNGSYFVD